MALQCPTCKKPLQITRYEGEKVGLCTACNGFFMGHKNLRNIEQSREVSIPMESVSPATASATIEGVRQCPKCKLDMIKKDYGELGAAVIDYCQSCRGIWLDPGELERIQVYYEAVNQAEHEVDSSFNCPKCGVAQASSDECSNCGIIFSKYQAGQNVDINREAGKINKSSDVNRTFELIRGFEIDQKYHLTEALFSFERKNEYSVSVLPASASRGWWHIAEINASGLSILGRNLFGLLYTFTMELTNEHGNKILRLYRQPRIYFHALDIHDENGVQIGHASRRFSYFNRVISVKNNKGIEMLRVVGPILKPWTFYLYKASSKVGVISKKWTGVLKEAYTDADKFNMRFSSPLDAKRKKFSVGALMLIDSLYFEGNKGFMTHLISAPGFQIVVLGISLLVFAGGYFQGL